MTRDEALQEALWSYRASSRNATADELRKQFIASLAASGYAVVPVEATEKMIYSATVRPAPREDETMYSSIWRAMASATQEDK